MKWLLFISINSGIHGFDTHFIDVNSEEQCHTMGGALTEQIQVIHNPDNKWGGRYIDPKAKYKCLHIGDKL